MSVRLKMPLMLIVYATQLMNLVSAVDTKMTTKWVQLNSHIVGTLSPIHSKRYAENNVNKPAYHQNANQEKCPPNSYGPECEFDCKCENNSHCDSITGVCECNPGWNGTRCHIPCLSGRYGSHCTEVCRCVYSISCNKQDGSCECELFRSGELCDRINISSTTVLVGIGFLLIATLSIGIMCAKTEKRTCISSHSGDNNRSTTPFLPKESTKDNSASTSKVATTTTTTTTTTFTTDGCIKRAKSCLSKCWRVCTNTLLETWNNTTCFKNGSKKADDPQESADNKEDADTRGGNDSNEGASSNIGPGTCSNMIFSKNNCDFPKTRGGDDPNEGTSSNIGPGIEMKEMPPKQSTTTPSSVEDTAV